MASLDPTSFAPALKRLYPRGLAEILYPKCPFFGWVPKQQNFFGEAVAVVPFYGGTMGSTTFADAKGNKTNVSTVRFLVTRVKDYAIASVDAEVMMASANDKGAVARALDTQIKGATYTFGRSMAYQLYNNSGGARGVGDSSWTITGNDITLNDVNTIVNFEVGMVIQSASTDGTTGSVNAGEVTISAINRQTGVITTTESNISLAIPAVANSDYWFRAGDFGSCISGLASWVPVTAPTAGDSHFGVDRSVDPVRLAGVRYAAGTGSLMEEIVFDACAELAINGGQADTLFMHSKRFAQLLKSAHSKTWIDVNTDIPGLGYKALAFPTDYGTIKVMSDPNCPYAYGYLLDRDSWVLKSLGETPHFATDDGKKYQRESASDGIEFRIRGFHNLICEKPGHNCVITW